MASTTGGTNDKALNIAGRVARYFVDSKLTVLIALVALLAGLLAVLVTPREENPRIVVPAANIIVAKPGASPAEVEQLIVKPLEAILQGLQGVEHTYGTAIDSLGIVSVQFYVGENKEAALVRLYDRIMSNLDRIPPGTRQPLVKPVDVDDVPILTISLASNARDDRSLRRIANDVLEHLRRVEDVSVSFVLGGRPRQINVDLDLDRMRSYGVSLFDIRRALEATYPPARWSITAGSAWSRRGECCEQPPMCASSWSRCTRTGRSISKTSRPSPMARAKSIRYIGSASVRLTAANGRPTSTPAP
jgi:multidrug efflux pump subunit AcrB